MVGKDSNKSVSVLLSGAGRITVKDSFFFFLFLMTRTTKLQPASHTSEKGTAILVKLTSMITTSG